MRRPISVLLTLAVLMALAAAVLAFAARQWVDRPLDVPTQGVQVQVPPGAAAREVARLWVQAGVQAPDWALYAWFRASGDARRLRAGTYRLAPGDTPRQLLRKMVDGDEVLEQVRLPEGQTFRQWRRLLAQAPGLTQTLGTKDDAQVMAALGRVGQAPEGRFFPDTYRYPNGMTDLALLRRAAEQLDTQLAQAWATRQADLPLQNVEQALILASIVEKETGLAADRGKVAAVFVNRLRLGMPLQTDPTVIYGLGEAFDGNLRKHHLRTDHPFNTYTRRGLPPTPIAMPSRAAIDAVLHPASTRDLYFVARGDGSSQFSETLAEHNRAVARYQLGQGASR